MDWQTGPSRTGGLFVTPERWGWEFAPPPGQQMFQWEFNEPIWRQPRPYDPTNDDRWVQRSWGSLRTGVGISIVVALVGAACMCANVTNNAPKPANNPLFNNGFLVVIFGLLIGVVLLLAFMPRMFAGAQRRRRQDQYNQWVAAQRAGFERRHAQWRADRDRHGWSEQQRIGRSPWWYPIHIDPSVARRVDVFGGVPEGWSSLLTTMGASILAGGARVLVADLTGNDVAAHLRYTAGVSACPVDDAVLPEQAAVADFFAGLDAAAVRQILLATARACDPSADPHLHREVLQTVLNDIEAPYTPRRVAAALAVLRRLPRSGEDPELTGEEVDRLLHDAAIAGDADLGGVRTLHVLVKAIADDGPGGRAGLADLWRTPGLTVLRRSAAAVAQDGFARQAVDNAFVEALRAWLGRTDVRPRDVLVIAGGDRLGLESVEDLNTLARARGVRLVHLIERLRRSAPELLGSSDSASIFMRLGNSAEARVAVEHIGRGLKWMLSSITYSQGENRTYGTEDGYSRQFGEGTTTGPRDTSEHEETSASTTWGSSEQQGRSRDRSQTQAQTREFIAEPEQIQNMPPTGFIVVQAFAPASRRALFGDCSPALVSQPGVADRPRAVPA
ncbi:hypothetical protein [Dactylosporangium sp. CA-092794]|uniref:hypothetical protein n=1 Tax=Dactylosporangium sp. CA-092794 TaxID=3239929 RepID=UPI003D8F8340